MNSTEFQKKVDLLENKDYETLASRITSTVENLRLLHAAIGACTEVGELQDLIKKKVIYGKEIDKDKLVDELGDILWYLGLACNALDVSMEEVMDKNWKKLSLRYGEKFSEQAALNKNKEAEWEAQKK